MNYYTWPPFLMWTLCGDTSGEWVEWQYPMGTAIYSRIQP